MPVDAATTTLLAGGLAKGNASYFDIYDSVFRYVGSVKVRRGTVFSEQITEYFSGVPLTIKRLKDGLVWERSQSVYAASPSSVVGRFLTGNDMSESSLRSLKKAITD
jgi:hypothetical protein